MKIRTDFVSNSSSSSFFLFAKKASTFTNYEKCKAFVDDLVCDYGGTLIGKYDKDHEVKDYEIAREIQRLAKKAGNQRTKVLEGIYEDVQYRLKDAGVRLVGHPIGAITNDNIDDIIKLARKQIGKPAQGEMAEWTDANFHKEDFRFIVHLLNCYLSIYNSKFAIEITWQDLSDRESRVSKAMYKYWGQGRDEMYVKENETCGIARRH